jgi:hypothetical protein
VLLQTEHKGVIALLKSASDKTRSRFKDIQFQRNKRRKAAAASTSLHSRSWYLTVNSWITGTTAVQDDAEEAVAEVSMGDVLLGEDSAWRCCLVLGW